MSRLKDLSAEKNVRNPLIANLRLWITCDLPQQTPSVVHIKSLKPDPIITSCSVAVNAQEK